MNECESLRSENWRDQLAFNEAINKLNSELSTLRAENERLRNSLSEQNNEVCQTLGKALGYPRYCDDQVNFPDATEANGVCVGEHVAESLASEMAAEYVALRERCEAAEKLVASAPEFTIWPVWIRHRLMNQRLHWEAYNWITGQTLMKDKMPVQFESPQHAVLGAIAAGWLPDSNNKGGE